jgi:PadR family transcriptional regulator, regulatory protein PadR
MDVDNSYLEIEMNRGFLQLFVLAASEQKTYGYLMLRQMKEIGYSVDENTLYPLLRRLEKNGWVRSEWEVHSDRPRKFYVITPMGKQVREKGLAIWRGQHAVLLRMMEMNNVRES